MPTDLIDDELTAEAMAADPDPVIGPDAVPFDALTPGFDPLLPSWYMPGRTYRSRSTPARRAAVLVVILGFLVVNAFGLCITYGHLVPA